MWRLLLLHVSPKSISQQNHRSDTTRSRAQRCIACTSAFYVVRVELVPLCTLALHRHASQSSAAGRISCIRLNHPLQPHYETAANTPARAQLHHCTPAKVRQPSEYELVSSPTNQHLPDAMQDEPQPRAKRLLRKGVCIVAPLLLVAATVYAKVIARRRWEGRAAVKGYGDVFKRQAIKESAKLKGATAEWVPFEARKHPDTPTKLWGNVKRPFPTGAWWTNLVVGGPSSSGDGLGTAFATPYTVAVLPDQGVVLGYGEVLASNESLTLATSHAVRKSNSQLHLLDGVQVDTA